MSKLLMFFGVFAFISLAGVASYFQYSQCLADGYNKTQCWMMIQAAGNKTQNVNVFGVK